MPPASADGVRSPSASAHHASRLRPAADASRRRPLAVVTRERGKNAKLASALSARGVAVVELPLIEHRPGPDRHELPSALAALRPPSWVAVTSPEAAAVLASGWDEAGRPAIRAAAVGGATSDALRKLCGPDLAVGFVPSVATAAALARELPGPSGDGDLVLYPASSRAGRELQELLSARGFDVRRLNTYDTAAVASVDPAALDAALQADVITFGSPSAVAAWTAVAGEDASGRILAVACIGETSAAAAREAGLGKVYFPPKPGMDGWVECVAAALKDLGKPIEQA